MSLRSNQQGSVKNQSGESDQEEENDTNVSQVSSEVIGVSSSHSQEKAGGGTGFGMGARGRSVTQLGLGTRETS